MKSYSSAWFASVCIGWTVAILCYLADYFLTFGFPEADVFYLWMMVIASPIFSFILSAIFVFPFRKQLEKLISVVPKGIFALLLATYGLVIIIPTLHWLTGLDMSYPKHRLVFANAAINGFVYGFAFYSFRKPTINAHEIWTTSTTPS